MNIALTGSSGLIGSLLIKDLEAMGHKVLCISSSRSSHESNKYLYDEILSGKHVLEADCLMHLASLNSELKESDIDKEVALSVQAIKCMDILKCHNMIFFSSIKVYGDNSFYYQQFNEDSPLDPKCFYGVAKKKCEETIAKLALELQLNFTIFRLPPLLINHSKSNLGKLFQLAERKWPFPSFRSGDSNRRSFLPYSLLKEVIYKTLDGSSNAKNQIFNLTSSKAISTNSLFRSIGDSVGKKIKIIYLPNFLFQLMMRVGKLELLLCRLYGNFDISNAKLKQEFNISDES